MFSTLVVILLCYLLYDGIQRLLAHEGTYGTAQWATLALCIIYVPFIIISGIRAFKTSKESKSKREEEQAKEREKLAERKRKMFLDESDEMEYKTDEDDEYYDDSYDEDGDEDDGDIFEADSEEIVTDDQDVAETEDSGE